MSNITFTKTVISKILSCLALFSLTSCTLTKHHINKNPAQELSSRINSIELELHKYSKGKSVDFYLAEDLVNLTGISTKKIDGNWIGIQYTPNKNEIFQWKRWFNSNKTKLYFEPYKYIKNGMFHYEFIHESNNLEKIIIPFDRQIISYNTKNGQIISSVDFKRSKLKRIK